MARTSSFWKVLSLGAIALAGLASAQSSTQPASKAVSQQPPKLEQVEPGSDVPETTVQSTPRTVISERRVNGQVVEADVVSSGSHYNLRPNVPAGNAQINDAQNNNSIRAPTWTVMQFGGKKKPPTEGAGPSSTADAPPPPMTK